MYAIVRSDIEMGVGKAASQAGHAYMGAFFHALGAEDLPGTNASSIFRSQALTYGQESPGTKVCLSGSLAQILRAQSRCRELGLPHFLVVDSGCDGFYGGEAIVTAFGLGPLFKSQAKPVVGKFRLHL